MTLEQALADAKALQLETARELTLFYIPKEYKSLKNAKLASFNLLKTSYGTSIAAVNQIVLQTSNGKSQVALSKTLDQLIRNTSRLTDGVNSIQINTKDFSTESLDTQSGPINMIKLLDDFENSRSKLSSLIPVLSKIKIGNNNLLSNLEVIFEANIVAIAAGLSLVSYPEVKAIAKAQGLAPIDNIDLGEVDATNSFIDQSINTIEKTANDIQTHFDQMHFTDKKTADSFKYGIKLLGNKKNSEDNQWIKDMESRDDEETIQQYMSYGLTRDEAELWLKYDKSFIEYCKRENLDAMQASQEYSANIASFIYGAPEKRTTNKVDTAKDMAKETAWAIEGGIISQKDLRAKFKKDFNFSDEEFDKLGEGFKRNHEPKDYQDDPESKHPNVVSPDGTTIPFEDYNSIPDIAHIHGALAIMINDDINVDRENEPHIINGSGAGNGPTISEPGDKPYGDRSKDGMATLLGDIASGEDGVDKRDAISDADALNIITRQRDTGYTQGPITVLDEYNQKVTTAENPVQARMLILIGADDEYNGYFDSREDLKNYLQQQISDFPDVAISIVDGNFNGTKKAADKMWGYFKGELPKLNDANNEAKN